MVVGVGQVEVGVEVEGVEVEREELGAWPQKG